MSAIYEYTDLAHNLNSKNTSMKIDAKLLFFLLNSFVEHVKSGRGIIYVYQYVRARLFKTNDVVS